MVCGMRFCTSHHSELNKCVGLIESWDYSGPPWQCTQANTARTLLWASCCSGETVHLHNDRTFNKACVSLTISSRCWPQSNIQWPWHSPVPRQILPCLHQYQSFTETSIKSDPRFESRFPAADPDVHQIERSGLILLSASVISQSVTKSGQWLYETR